MDKLFESRLFSLFSEFFVFLAVKLSARSVYIANCRSVVNARVNEHNNKMRLRSSLAGSLITVTVAIVSPLSFGEVPFVTHFYNGDGVPYKTASAACANQARTNSQHPTVDIEYSNPVADCDFSTNNCACICTITYHWIWGSDPPGQGYCGSSLRISPDCPAGLESNGSGCVGVPDETIKPPTTCVANPVDPLSGNKYQREIDFPAVNGLSVVRHYNSTSREFGSFGYSWTSSLDSKSLWVGADQIIVFRDTGQLESWTKSGSQWSGPDDSNIEIVETSSGYIVTLIDGSTELYGPTGKLLSATDINGLELTYAYDPKYDRLVSVSNNFGQSIQIFYDIKSHISRIELPDNQVIRYQYTYNNTISSSAGNLSKVIYDDDTPADEANNPYRQYHYDHLDWPGDHLLTRITDENGVGFATWTYPYYTSFFYGAGSSEHNGGVDKHIIDYTYINDLLDRRVTVTNPLNKQTTYHFQVIDGRRKITSVEGHVLAPDCAATSQSISYDTNGYKDIVVDRNGNVSDYDFNATGLLEALTEAKSTPLERVYRTQWDSSLRLKTFESLEGQWEVDYDYYAGSSRVKSVSKRDLTAYTFPYASNGNMRTETYRYTYYDPAFQGQLKTKSIDGPRTDVNDITVYQYNANGFVSKVINALGHEQEVTDYDGAGRPLRMVDSNGVVSMYTYTPRGWVDTITQDFGGANAVTDFDYDKVGQIKQITQPNGAYLEYFYDGAHRLYRIEDEQSNYIIYTLDDAGNIDLEEIYDNNGSLRRSIDYVYDELSRLRNTIGSTPGIDRSEHKYDYDLNDNLKVSQLGGSNGNNPVTRMYDELNRIKKIIHADGNPGRYESEYSYDSQDNITSVTDQRDLVTTYQYDGLGNLMQVDSPDSGVTAYTYDAAGNRTSKTDARGVVTSYRYDRLNRLVAVEYPSSPEENISYRYDETAGGNKGLGRLTRLQDESGVTLFFYNALGQMVRRTHLIEGITYVWQFGYDLAGKLTRLRYPSGRTVIYDRDKDRIISILTTAWDGAQKHTLVDNVVYLPFGPLAQFEYGNGVTHAIGYDLDYRVGGVISTLNATLIQAKTLSYYNTNNMKEILDALDSSRSQMFDYDQENRLDTASGSYGVLDYDYDGVGNRTKLQWDQDGNQSVDFTEDYVYKLTSNWLDTLTKSPGGSVDFDYSASGQMTDDSRNNTVLSYNDADRLSSISGGQGSGSYTYNALGQRVIRQATHSSVEHVHYHYGQAGKRLAETANDGSVINEYVFIDNLLVWYFTDELSADTDNDLMDDNWEQQHFNDLDQTAITDSDGDGLLDIEEFRRGTNPTVTDTMDLDGDGFTLAAGDWDDFDSQSYPGAEEICGDGIDQDNSGSDSPCGDINGDGELTAADILLLSQNLAGVRTLGGASLARADLYPLDGDGQLTLSDMLILQKLVLGL